MSACSHCGGAKFTSFWGALILCIRCNGTGMEKEAHMTHPDDKAWDDLVERLKAPHYWMSGSDEGHEGENDAPREAADAVTSLRTQLAEVTAQRDAARKEEREACALLAAANEAAAARLEELWRETSAYQAAQIRALTPTDAAAALSRMLAEARADEREQCAKAAENVAKPMTGKVATAVYDYCRKTGAAAIRARKEPT